MNVPFDPTTYEGRRQIMDAREDAFRRLDLIVDENDEPMPEEDAIAQEIRELMDRLGTAYISLAFQEHRARKGR